ncbi:MAG: peptidase S16 [bacterium]|nr:peptidase S16 [bacterium]
MVITERYNKLSDLPSSLPVFPLRGIVLLPRTALPFNIFEPRYLELIDDVLGGQRLIGLIQPASKIPQSRETAKDEPFEHENSESPQDRNWPLRKAGCIGRITGFEEQENGHMAITLTGICRFEVEAETNLTKPYRICDINCEPYTSDLGGNEEEDEVDREKLLSLLRLYLNVNDMTADWRSIHRSSTDYLVNTLCIHSPYGPEEKQALLEAKTLKIRAEILMALAEMEIASKNEGGGTLQ